MNYKTACLNLGISIVEDEPTITMEEIKQNYRIKALQYHPDKNPSPDAASKFQEIHESYEYLMKYEGFMDDDNEYLEMDDTPDLSGNLFYRLFMKNNYNNILFSFLQILLKDTETTNLFHAIITRIMNLCQDSAIETMNNLNLETLKKLHMILQTYKVVLHLRDEFLENIESIIQEKENLNGEMETIQKEYIILNPILDDLFENNLYKLTVNGFTYAIPLWHGELIYDNSGCDIHVSCFPILPENIELDENNNLFVDVTYNISDIWEKEVLDIHVGKRLYPITVGEIKLKKEQTFLFINQGISRINTNDVYDISKQSNVYINLTLKL